MIPFVLSIVCCHSASLRWDPPRNGAVRIKDAAAARLTAPDQSRTAGALLQSFDHPAVNREGQPRHRGPSPENPLARWVPCVLTSHY